MVAHQPSWPVAVWCEVVGVGRSGFYAYQKRQVVPMCSREAIAGLARIKAISGKTQHSDGSRRMTTPLQDEGDDVGRFKVRRLRKQAGVSVEGRRRCGPKTTESRQGYGVAPNLLARHCEVTAPNVAWCGDSTDVWTAAGWG
jgi:transposase InsO family protein